MSLGLAGLIAWRGRTMRKRQVVIVGATGMVGGYVLRFALENPDVSRVLAVGRRKTGVSHPKLTEVMIEDFADCGRLARVLVGQDGAIFCHILNAISVDGSGGAMSASTESIRRQIRRRRAASPDLAQAAVGISWPHPRTHLSAFRIWS
jgi:uncharacterized protein YbjT (DUF2867 family)